MITYRASDVPLSIAADVLLVGGAHEPADVDVRRRWAHDTITLRTMIREAEIFGRRVLLERTGDTWIAYIPGDDGKRRALPGATIPSFVVSDDAVLQYLADLWHEEARPDRQTVRWLR